MAGKKPNVVFILTDDQGIWSMGCYGNYEIRTPNLDKLARQGVRFDNFFCTSPVCSPARASLLTGKIPSQHGILDYLSGGNGGASQAAIEFLKDHRGYTDILAEEGYTCGLSGKWHLGDGGHPQKGFSFWYAHQKGGGPYYNAPMFRDGKKVEEEGYITDIITDEAISFIDREKNKKQPFYLSVHYTAPHSPWIDCHPKKYTDLYEDCPFETCPQGETHPWAKTEVLAGYQRPRESLIGYFAAITAMDDNVGRILKKLEEENLMEDTLIIFSSDNGFNCGHHGIWGKGNGTFPLNMYDSSVKVPLIMCHKGHIPENQVCDEMHSGYDFMPTLLEYLGFENDEADELPGKSFLPALMGQEHKNEDGRVVVFDEYGPVRMIRSRKYKLVHRYPYGPDEFYDLEADPGETHNGIEDEQYQDMIQDMKKQMELWFLQYVDPRIDGAKEPVMGGGQRDLAGLLGPGINVYGENI
jgi:arylsulfatase A-like enzyme